MAAASSPWQQWFPAPAPENNIQWRVLRFAAVDAAGRPVGKAEEALAASWRAWRFANEQAAARHAGQLNAGGSP